MIFTDETTIMTAAHCLSGAERVEITAGAHAWREDEPTQQTRNSTRLLVHEGWGPITISNDIALAKVDIPFNFTGMKYVSSILLIYCEQ